MISVTDYDYPILIPRAARNLCPFRESKGAHTSEASVRGMPAGANLVVAPATSTHPSQFIIKNHRNHSSKTPLTTQTSVVICTSGSTDRHRAAQTCADPRPKRPQGYIREETKAKRQRQRGYPPCRVTASSRPLAASLIRSEVWCKAGRVRAEALGGRVPGARRISPASHSEPAGIVRSERTMPSQGPGDPRGADRRLLLSAAGVRLQRARSPKS